MTNNEMAKPSTFPNMVITLVVVTAVSAVALGFVYEWTKEPIAQARLATQLKAIEAVMSGYDNNPVQEKFYLPTSSGDSLECFPGKKGNTSIGVAIKTKSSKGYSGDIWLMVGFDTTGIVRNIVVIEHKETPGLGSKMTSEKFLNQYLNVNPATTDLRVKKDGGTVDAISGATISSRAFSEAVKLASDSYQAYGKDH
ncbi:MAG: RnfABCDGE type electron transport complex subunit G [Flammeovirgaceae bacterium]